MTSGLGDCYLTSFLLRGEVLRIKHMQNWGQALLGPGHLSGPDPSQDYSEDAGRPHSSSGSVSLTSLKTAPHLHAMLSAMHNCGSFDPSLPLVCSELLCARLVPSASALSSHILPPPASTACWALASALPHVSVGFMHCHAALRGLDINMRCHATERGLDTNMHSKGRVGHLDSTSPKDVDIVLH